jgi:hypothetical protein
LQQMYKHCRVVAKVPHLQVRPVFSRHSDKPLAVGGQAEHVGEIHCRGLYTQRENVKRPTRRE